LIAYSQRDKKQTNRIDPQGNKTQPAREELASPCVLLPFRFAETSGGFPSHFLCPYFFAHCPKRQKAKPTPRQKIRRKTAPKLNNITASYKTRIQAACPPTGGSYKAVMLNSRSPPNPDPSLQKPINKSGNECFSKASFFCLSAFTSPKKQANTRRKSGQLPIDIAISLRSNKWQSHRR
jgi:hypothetical protein